MIRWIVRRVIKDHTNITDPNVRESYTVLAGTLGVAGNLLLFVLKLSAGLLSNSIAVISDAFNNLSDMSSSLVTILGAKLSNLPPDEEHPHGHGRVEYVAALIVSFIILWVGLQLLRSSFQKILVPEEVQVSPLLLIILVFGVFVKLWMFSYNKYISETIRSSLSRAAAYDSLNDVMATSVVIVGAVLSRYVAFPIDGLLGLAMSLLILYTGFNAAKESISLLLGSSPDPELVDQISALVLEGSGIIGVHDLTVHDYGPGRVFASIHAEVVEDASLVDMHTEIDAIERRVEDELGIRLVIHMDPTTEAVES